MKYRLLDKLGQGGMGIVFRARHTELDRDVAIKFLPEEFARTNPTSAERFIREARACIALNHPNVVKILDAGEADGRLFYVMEMLSARDLEAVMRERGPVAAELALSVLDQVLDALEYCHARRMIHRDIKPANIMLESSGRVILMDFGLVKDTTRTVLTQDGRALGTPRFMPPEQVSGKPASPQGDLWSLGVTAWELLAGRRLFDAPSLKDLVRAIIMDPVPTIASLRPELPPYVDRIVMRFLERDLAKRYASASAARTDVREAMDLLSIGSASATLAGLVVSAGDLAAGGTLPEGVPGTSGGRPGAGRAASPGASPGSDVGASRAEPGALAAGAQTRRSSGRFSASAVRPAGAGGAPEGNKGRVGTASTAALDPPSRGPASRLVAILRRLMRRPMHVRIAAGIAGVAVLALGLGLLSRFRSSAGGPGDTAAGGPGALADSATVAGGRGGVAGAPLECKDLVARFASLDRLEVTFATDASVRCWADADGTARATEPSAATAHRLSLALPPPASPAEVRIGLDGDPAPRATLRAPPSPATLAERLVGAVRETGLDVSHPWPAFDALNRAMLARHVDGEADKGAAMCKDRPELARSVEALLDRMGSTGGLREALDGLRPFLGAYLAAREVPSGARASLLHALDVLQVADTLAPYVGRSEPFRALASMAPAVEIAFLDKTQGEPPLADATALVPSPTAKKFFLYATGEAVPRFGGVLGDTILTMAAEEGDNPDSVDYGDRLAIAAKRPATPGSPETPGSPAGPGAHATDGARRFHMLAGSFQPAMAIVVVVPGGPTFTFHRPTQGYQYLATQMWATVTLRGAMAGDPARASAGDERWELRVLRTFIDQPRPYVYVTRFLTSPAP